MKKLSILVLLVIGLLVFVGCDGEIGNNSDSLNTIDEIIDYYDEWGLETVQKPYVYFGIDDETNTLDFMDISWDIDEDYFHYSIMVESYTNTEITGTYETYENEVATQHDITIQVTYSESNGLSLVLAGSSDGGLEGKSYTGLQPNPDI
nr:hypothetical protein [uncultured Sphaerochaeta sp.]